MAISHSRSAAPSCLPYGAPYHTRYLHTILHFRLASLPLPTPFSPTPALWPVLSLFATSHILHFASVRLRPPAPTTRTILAMAGRVVLCPHPDCRQAFASETSLSKHVAQKPVCRAFMDHSREVFEGRQVKAKIVAGSARDMEAEIWQEGPDDAEYDPEVEEMEEEEEERIAPRRSTKTTVEDVPEEEEEEEEAQNGIGEDSDYEDERPAQYSRAAARELREMRGIEELFDITDDTAALGEAGPGPSTLRNRLSQRIGTRPRFLDDDDTDEDSGQFIDEHPTAGRSIRMNTALHRQWFALFGNPLPAADSAKADTPADSEDVPMSDGTGTRDENLYRPFASKLDWEIAQWMVKDGIGHSSFNRLLNIEGVREKLGLTYDNTAGLHRQLENIPLRAGKWHVKHLTFPDRESEPFILRHRDILEAVKALWGDPKFANRIVFKPSRIFTDRNRTHCIVNEMWTAEWWWQVQDLLPEGHTLGALIISTDKTQLTDFSGSRQAYPVYLTLGNIPSSLRRKPSEQACILVAYLPVDKVTRCGLSKDEVGARYQQLFHAAMTELFKPLVEAGKNGVQMASGDGRLWMVHPILAAYVADYPEQCLVTCSKQKSCPKCHAGPDELDADDPLPMRNQKSTLTTLSIAKSIATSNTDYRALCYASNINPNVTKPFWTDLPFTNIHLAQTPDVLHQLYQGVLRHLIDWCQRLLSDQELDARIRRLPPGLGLRHFKNGISALTQISGSERKNMGKILLACVVDRLPPQAATAVRSILDFIYLAQYRTHDEETLGYMTEALERWRKNKDIFIRLKVREDFNIPKFHALVHYVEMIKLLGTTENFNTEMFERLHIEFAKKGWRASNHRNEFPQMTQWVNRQERVATFGRYLEWHHATQLATSSSSVSGTIPTKDKASAVDKGPAADEDVIMRPTTAGTKAFQQIILPKNPTLPRRHITVTAHNHDLPNLNAHIRKFLNTVERDNSPNPRTAFQHASLPFDRIDVFHSFKLSREGLDDETRERDWVKASPENGGRYDTVIVLDSDEAEVTGLQGTRIGRVRLIFKLPATYQLQRVEYSYPVHWPKHPLAYIEWYTRPVLRGKAAATHNLPQLEKAVDTHGDPNPLTLVVYGIQTSLYWILVLISMLITG
ncbi:hypothetical protein CYLTODRAFT_454797 [Cylindrobasidium torrendii FP15055 ss-10]|uniref:DUF6830 domain-containing protein n=1 Tax=Cylindrobasidium torrendii FP15055 ss-10 TaxID=1314674 RepID=A0A0D7B9B0_9AGAR|nr:hypothetical protein CYLTODRAFT_454797 [Cylindrobasidium torrendii FP15055 ss-10]